MRLLAALCLSLAWPTLAEARASAPLLSLQNPPSSTKPAELPDKRPEVEAMTKKLLAHASKKGAEDMDAIGVVDQLVQEFEKCGPKDRALVVKSISRCFEERRLEKAGEPPNNKLYMACAVALSTMGPESTKELLNWIGHKELKKDMALQQRLILSVGKTKDASAIKPLQDMLFHKDNVIVAAAAEALGNYEELEIEARKKLFESMLKVLMSQKGMTDAEPNSPALRERYDIIAAPIITTLQKLSRHTERDPVEWQRWWNKNKGKNWDK
jgi:hypothetical protein